MQELNDPDVQEEGEPDVEKVSRRSKIASKRPPKTSPLDTTDISQLIIPAGVYPAPVKLIQTIIENKFTDTGIEKNLKENFGNAFRDAVREIQAQIAAEKKKKDGGEAAGTQFGDGLETAGDTSEKAKITGKSEGSGKPPGDVKTASTQPPNSSKAEKTDSEKSPNSVQTGLQTGPTVISRGSPSLLRA